MKADLIKEFNLPGYIKGKSFADASKAIDKKFSERTDSAAMETKQELMGRLAKAQEYVKMQESLKANSGQVPDRMNGQVPEGFEEFAPQQGQNQMFFGGEVPVEEPEVPGAEQESAWGGMDGAQKAGAVAGMAGTAMELGQTAFGDTGIDISGASGRAKAGSIGGGVASGAMKGASAGAALGPWGAAAGAVVGGGLGAIGAGKAQKEQLTANMNADAISNNKFTNDFFLGGFQNATDPTDPKKKLVGPADPSKPNTGSSPAYNKMVAESGIMSFPYTGGAHARIPSATEQASYLDTVKDKGIPAYDFYNDPDKKMKDYSEAEAETSIDGAIAQEDATPEQRKAIKALELKYKVPTKPTLGTTAEEDATSTINQFSKTAEQTTNRNARMKEIFAEHEASDPRSKLNASRLAEFAPAAMSAYQLATMEKPERESLDRVGARYKTDYVDEKALENRVQNEHNNVSRSLAGASNGSMGALRSNLLGANKNKTEAINDAYLKADDINRQEDRVAQQFNSRNDMINLQQSNREKENAARDEGAYKTNKSMLQANLAENIGGVAREATDRKSIAKMFGYDVEGEYVVGKDGKKKTWKEFQKEVKAYQKSNK